MSKLRGKTPPVLREMVRKRIDELLREAEPFTSFDVATPRIVEFIEGLDVSEKYHGVTDSVSLVGHLVRAALKTPKYRDRVFRRFDRQTMKFQKRRVGNRLTEVFYTSNDRERYHLAASEVFLRFGAPKRDTEPPVRVNGTATEAVSEPEAEEVTAPELEQQESEAQTAVERRRQTVFTVAGWRVTIESPIGLEADWGASMFEAEILVWDEGPMPSRLTLAKDAR